MKLFFMSVILLLSVKCFSQDYYTIVAKNFYVTNNGVKTKVNGVISLTYSKEQSVLYIEGKGSLSFQNEQYTRDLNEGSLHENFLSGETSTTLYGHYSISIYQMKNNNIIVIGSFKTGATFYAEHAQLYSENGKVVHNPYVENWKELLETEELRKNLVKTKEKLINDSIRKVEVKDSIRRIQLDSMKMVEAENKLLSGDTFIAIDRSVDFTLNSIVEKSVKLKKNEFIYSNWKITIDKEGIITNAQPDEKYKGGHIISSYVSAINNALINQRIKPFVAQNGNKYPFYSNVYINLSYVIEKKRLKLKDALKMLPMGSFF